MNYKYCVLGSDLGVRDWSFSKILESLPYVNVVSLAVKVGVC